MKIPEPLQQVDRTYVRVNGRKLSYFAGCDYFRLASHPKVLRAAVAGINKFGLNVAASRLTTGNHELFGKLETALAKFFEAETAVLVSNGYVTNLVVAQALAGDFSHVLMDEKAHPSLKDAAQILSGHTVTFRHLDPLDLKRLIAKLPKSAKPILLTDGMFSHDGAIAPLQSYLKILPKNGVLLLDDAHGAGTLGRAGGGTIELAQISRELVIQCITLSKAFGCYGGAILCTNQLRERIISRSRMFVGNTPLPLPLANAAISAVGVLQKENGLRRRLNENVTWVRKELRKAGYTLADSQSPILAITPKASAEANRIKERCLKNKVFPSFIKYPGGPEDGYFRFVISSEHSREQLGALVASLSA
ncbi:MAG: pyridoxal phosphate-dependent aminotransferase family protein [Verrucomicrobia bacterium]|nr:pyridoxal phosphate-dependent aminotransferase family protein [Verrucomicrobiota bacterium]